MIDPTAAAAAATQTTEMTSLGETKEFSVTREASNNKEATQRHNPHTSPKAMDGRRITLHLCSIKKFFLCCCFRRRRVSHAPPDAKAVPRPVGRRRVGHHHHHHNSVLSPRPRHWSRSQSCSSLTNHSNSNLNGAAKRLANKCSATAASPDATDRSASR